MNSEEREQSDFCEAEILAHVELYRLTIAPAVERLFFSEKQIPVDESRLRAVDALNELVQRGMFIPRQLPKAKGAQVGETYYVLPSTKSAKEPADPQTIDFDLQTLWFATLSEHRFHRLSVTETRRLFTNPPHHHVRHVIGNTGDGPFVGRIYPSKVGVKETIPRLKQFITEARTKHGLSSWIDTGDYGFCVLVDNMRKVEAVAEATLSKRQGAGALADQARIQVAFAPTAGTLSEAISEL